MPDAPRQRSKVLTLRKGEALRVDGVIVVRKTVTIEIIGDADAERVMPDCQPAKVTA